MLEPPRIEPGVYLEAIRANAATLVGAAEAAGLDAEVPPCPGWSVTDLLAHIGRVHRWAAANTLRVESDPPLSRRDHAMPSDADPVAWVREGADIVVAALDRPPDDPAWTFFPPATVAFWQRRQAHETAMHRVDAESAAGDVHAIDAALAADGIDELLDLFRARPLGRSPAGAGETIHFHCTDVAGEWLVTLRADGIDVAREHAKGDVAARGTASDLLCWMHGRGPVDRLEVFGDDALLERWREGGTL